MSLNTKYLLRVLIIIGFLFHTCETMELEKVDDPNSLTSGDPEFFFNNIQIAYLNSQETFDFWSSRLTRIYNMGGPEPYFNKFGVNTTNGVWRNLYSDIIPDIAQIESLQTGDKDLRMQLAISKIMQAHLIMQTVDFLGDIVSMDLANDPQNHPSPMPTSDGGKKLYREALELLDEAVLILEQNPTSIQNQDLYFQGDSMAWIRVANTLKLRAALTQSQYENVLTMAQSVPHISSIEDDFEFQYGDQLSPITTQSPEYISNYSNIGATGLLRSNWLMNYMLQNNDPRIRYYFYRQTDCTPGASCNPNGDGETITCSLENVPRHIQNTPCEDIWCSLENGYWGSTHFGGGNGFPNSFLRTAPGIYPCAGKFDDDDYGSVGFGLGGNGAGILPIILASYVDFWLAEASLAMGNINDATNYLEAGINKSIEKVHSFINLDPDADPDYIPSNSDVQEYINGLINSFMNANEDGKWNILAEQYWVAMYGGGADAHNFYRRTGYPTTLCPPLSPQPGNYPRTFLYPSIEVISNPNFIQRTNNDEAVFWNTQPLPIAN